MHNFLAISFLLLAQSTPSPSATTTAWNRVTSGVVTRLRPQTLQGVAGDNASLVAGSPAIRPSLELT